MKLNDIGIAVYTRSTTECDSTQYQFRLISKYCERHDISDVMSFSDTNQRNRHSDEISRAEQLGFSTSKWSKTLPGFETLLTHVINGDIGTIIVDTKIRLYGANNQQKSVVETLFKVHGVKVIEAGKENVLEGETGMLLYHYSTGTACRPIIALKDIDEIYLTAEKTSGDIAGLFVDECEVDEKRELHPKMYEVIESRQISHILVHHAYHFEKKAVTLYERICLLNYMGIKVITVHDGTLKVETENQELLGRPLKVAVYNRCISKPEEQNQEFDLERITLFCRLKTNWQIVGNYIESPGASGKPQLEKMIGDQEKYDLILVKTLNSISGGTNEFFTFKHRLHNKIIFCMRNGGAIM